MFDPVVYAKDGSAPLVANLCALAEAEGRADQHAFFTRVHDALAHATASDDLAGPFMEISTSAFRGFAYRPAVGPLLDRVLERVQLLAESLSLDEGEIQ